MKIKFLILALLFPLVSFGANTNIIDNAVIKNLTVTNSAITYVGIMTSNTFSGEFVNTVQNFSTLSTGAAGYRSQNNTAGHFTIGIANTNATTANGVFANYGFARTGASAAGFQLQLASVNQPVIVQYGIALIPSLNLNRLSGYTTLGMGLGQGTNNAAQVHLGPAEETGAQVATNAVKVLIQGPVNLNKDFLIIQGGKRGAGVTNITVNNFGTLQSTTNVIVQGQGVVVGSISPTLVQLIQGVHATYGGTATNITWPIAFATVPFVSHATTTSGGTAVLNDTFFTTNITTTGCTIGYRTAAGLTSAATLTVDITAFGTK